MNQSSPLVGVVEDEPKIATLLEDYLRHAGYRTHAIGDGLAVIPWVRSASPDLLLLDVMLPGREGLEVLRELRGFTQLPVIMVTARIEEIDRLLGLELGADDYICKPFSPREVVSRVKAVLRRVQAVPSTERQRLHLDTERFEAQFNGQLLKLTRTEFNLLARLAGQPGRVYSRDQLLDTIYDDHRVVSARTVDSHVKNLRRKLADAAPGEDPLRSIYGVGYKLEM